MKRTTMGMAFDPSQCSTNGLTELLRCIGLENYWQEDPARREELTLIHDKIQKELKNRVP